MDELGPSLEDLRREIDEIDTAIHDLLMRRSALVDKVAQAKGSGELLNRLHANRPKGAAITSSWFINCASSDDRE